MGYNKDSEVNRIKYLKLNSGKISSLIDELMAVDDINKIAGFVGGIIEDTEHSRNIRGIFDPDSGDAVTYRCDAFINQLNQVKDAKTRERANYYLRRLKRSITEKKTTYFSDINLLRWKEYDDIITDSLWVMQKRDSDPNNLAWYWGNFIPQIPRQLLLRYTKEN
ncbi:MAG: DNA methyltransferase, partial [Thermoplasmata archaeon]